MRDAKSKKSKFSWPKTLVKKWFNIRSKAEDFHADDQGVDEEWSRFTESEACIIKKSKTEKRIKVDPEAPQATDVHNYGIFAATWNVAGKSPPSYLNLKEWLHTSPPADVYVLGFQEIVPLNAVNVLGTEDNGPAQKWTELIRKTLNSIPSTNENSHFPSPIHDPIMELESDFEGSTRQTAPSFANHRSFHSLSRSMRMTDSDMSSAPRLDRRFSVSDRVIFGNRPSDYDQDFGCSSDDENEGCGDTSSTTSVYSYNGGLIPVEDKNRQSGKSRYCLVASKQMVGIFLTVWVKSDLRDSVRNMKVSCVGRGLMGYLGNKGSISISMSLHQTTFCFICSHLTSGQKEGDELRRNSDVMEILKKTRFPRVQSARDDNKSPQTILEHDRIIWIGDLNYRIALSYRAAKALVEMQNWRVLLQNDQLRIEKRQGRVFEGWSEGRISFPPTYKYSYNSDRYAWDDMQPKDKRRTPAWCDRILWYGRGLEQLSYVRGESRFSDHRPVYSVFLAEVESIKCTRIKKSMSSVRGRIEIEELLPYSLRYN